jgi:hypothetical protein
MIKRYTVAFGGLFSNLEVLRYDQNGAEVQRVVVPLTYANKEKFIQRITQDENHERQDAITLPRIAFEMTSLNYDGQRKLQKLNKYHYPREEGDVGSVYTPVPYDIMFNVYVVTKTQDEMLQIIEQILPAFTPDYVISMAAIGSPETTFDVPLTCLDVAPSDSFEGQLEDRRQIMWSMSFLMKAVLFGPISQRKIILYPEGNLYGWEALFQDE